MPEKSVVVLEPAGLRQLKNVFNTMEDFTLTMHCGYPSQDIIVGGGEDSPFTDDISPVPDISNFVNEEVIFEDIEGGATSSSDDGGFQDDLINVTDDDPVIVKDRQLVFKEESEDSDDDDSSLSVKVDFDKLNRIKLGSKNRQYVFVTEDGKTAECFDDNGKIILKLAIRSII